MEVVPGIFSDESEYAFVPYVAEAALDCPDRRVTPSSPQALKYSSAIGVNDGMGTRPGSLLSPRDFSPRRLCRL